jgi:RNA polymerase sigma-70 factor, ECF subfamily
LIIAAIDRLPENYRIVLLLRDIGEMSTTETAEVLEMTESKVKVSLHRARAALKKLLEPVI